MPSFRSRQGANYSRKSRRVAKYGKYARPAGGSSRVGYGKGRGPKKIMVPRFHNPFTKDHELVQLTYHETITIDPAIDTSGAHLFKLNGLYDPNFSGTGHQPMYFDNYATLYNKYKVSFAKFNVTIVNHNVNTAVWNGTTGTLNTQPNYSYRLAILRDQDSTDTTSSMDALIEQNAANVKWRFVAPQLNGRMPKLSIKCAPHKQCGVSYDDDTLTTVTTSDPGKTVYARVILASADGVTNPPAVSAIVTIRYFVKFFDRKVNQPLN